MEEDVATKEITKRIKHLWDRNLFVGFDEMIGKIYYKYNNPLKDCATPTIEYAANVLDVNDDLIIDELSEEMKKKDITVQGLLNSKDKRQQCVKIAKECLRDVIDNTANLNGRILSYLKDGWKNILTNVARSKTLNDAQNKEMMADLKDCSCYPGRKSMSISFSDTSYVPITDISLDDIYNAVWNAYTNFENSVYKNKDLTKDEQEELTRIENREDNANLRNFIHDHINDIREYLGKNISPEEIDNNLEKISRVFFC